MNEKYYEVNKVKPEDMMEDFFAEEEKEKFNEMIDEGWTALGMYDKDTPEEEVNAMLDKAIENME